MEKAIKLQFGNPEHIKMVKDQLPAIQMVECPNCGKIKPVEYHKEFRDTIVNYPIKSLCDDCFE